MWNNTSVSRAPKFLFEHARQRLQEKRLLGHEARLNAVLVQGLGDYRTDRCDYGFRKRLRDDLCWGDAEQALDLWGAREGDGVYFPCLHSCEEGEHGGIVGRIGVNVRRNRRDRRAGGFKELDEGAVG